MKRLLAIIFLLVPALAFAGSGTQYSGITSMTFQDGVSPTVGYAGSEFTFICDAAADSGKNFGAADTLYLSGAGNTAAFHTNISKILGKFNLSDLPDSAVITQAYFEIYQIGGAAGAALDSLSLHRIYPPFTEGTGAQAGTASQASATWTTRHATDSPADVFTTGKWGTAGCNATASAGSSPGLSWGSGADSSISPTFVGADTLDVKSSTVVGVDYVSEPATIGRPKTGAPAGSKAGWVVVDVTRQVRLWHIGANTNNGFVIQMHNTLLDKQFKYFSDDYDNVPYRPKLIVQFFDPESAGSSGSGTGGAGKRIIGDGRAPKQ